MTDEDPRINDWRTAVQTAWMVASMLGCHELERLVADGERAESTGPFFAPTLWREKREALAVDLRVLRAALRFRREIEAIAQEGDEGASR